MTTIIVETPSRLHFSLIDLNGELQRIDGGLGIALQRPGFKVCASNANTLEISGKTSDRFTETIVKFAKAQGLEPKARIEIFETIPQHVGLGSGTQCALALGYALARLHGLELSPREIGGTMGRGSTSGVGIAVFEGGGFNLDGGHRFGTHGDKVSFQPTHMSNASPAPLLLRYRVPEEWRFVVAIPNVGLGKHSSEEVAAFAKFCPIPAAEVANLCRLILVRLLPSLVERDAKSFGQALSQIQDIGFKKTELELQDPIVEELLHFFVEKGALGAGMSSFGPTAYGLVDEQSTAEQLAESVREFLDNRMGGDVFFSKVNNSGAKVSVIE
ncbi:MAG: beta-ribofuranosylaminobenzene 5'-phosphate synthase [Candidatus Bathyarchaeia archaeon]